MSIRCKPADLFSIISEHGKARKGDVTCPRRVARLSSADSLLLGLAWQMASSLEMVQKNSHLCTLLRDVACLQGLGGRSGGTLR